MGQPTDNAWERIRGCERRTLTELFASDAQRVEKLSARLEWGDEEEPGGALFDWSKTHLDDELLAAFEALAEAQGFAAKRAALLAGERVNTSEDRAAEHTAQRGIGSEAAVEEASALHQRMHILVDAIHRGTFGEIGDQRLTVMAAITFADAVHDTDRRIGDLERRIAELEAARSEADRAGGAAETALAGVIEDAAGRIEATARRLAAEPPR